MSLRDRLICFVDFVGMTLLAGLFLLPPCRTPTAPLPSAISGTANSNKSATTRFATGVIYLRKNGIVIFPITCASAPNPRPRCRPTLL